MISEIKRYIYRHPKQSMLFAYNAGVFGWLQANVKGIMNLDDFTQGPLSWVPVEHLNSAKSFISSLPYGWLIASFFATLFIRRVTRFVRNVITLAIIGIGIYFMYGYAKTNGWI